MRKFYFLLLSTCFFALQSVAQSYNLHEWNFYGNNGKEESQAASATNVFLELGTITRGTAAVPNSGYSNGIAATLDPGSTEEDAVNAGFYFEFKVKGKDDSTVSLSSLFAQLRVQNTVTYRWKYSINDGEFKNLMTEPITMDAAVVGNVGVDQPEIDMSGIAELQNIPSSSTVTLRLYAWGGTDAVQGFAFGKSLASYNSSQGVLTYKASLVLKGEVKSQTQMLAGWDLSNLHDNVYDGSLSATTIDAGINQAVLSRGSAFTAGSLKYSYVSKIPIGVDKDPNSYFDIVLKANDNKFLNLKSLDYLFRRNTAGAEKYSWTYSTDGTNFNDLVEESEVMQNANGERYSIDLATITALQDLPSANPVTLRMHVWSANGEGNVFGFGRCIAGSVGVPGSFTVYLKGKVEDNMVGITPGQVSANNMYVINSVLVVNSNAASASKVQITDLTGKTVHSATIQLIEGNNEIDLPANLAKGIYIISANGQSIKFIKQ